MRKDKFIALAERVGFVIDRVEEQAFRFETLGFTCIGFLYYDRKGDEVMSVQLFCGFANRPDLSVIDDWNREMRFVKAYTSPHGQLSLEMDLIVPADMTPEHLRDSWRVWNQLLSYAPSRFDPGPAENAPAEI